MPNEALPIEVVQARLLLVLYEILKSNPSKGWISAGRCFHLVHLVKLDQIDNPNTWQTSSLSWVEIEERRRTFWTAYALDRYANLVNGLPLAMNDQMASGSSVIQKGNQVAHELLTYLDPHTPTRPRDGISKPKGCYDRISGPGHGEEKRSAAIALREIHRHAHHSRTLPLSQKPMQCGTDPRPHIPGMYCTPSST